MTLNDLLIKAHTHLDKATVEDGLGNEALCMLHLGTLHGLLLIFIGQTPTEKKRTCRYCGCTDIKACPGGCHWVTDDLCSICAKLN